MSQVLSVTDKNLEEIIYVLARRYEIPIGFEFTETSAGERPISLDMKDLTLREAIDLAVLSAGTLPMEVFGRCGKER